MGTNKEIHIHFADFGDMGGIKRRICVILEQKYRVILDDKNPQYLFYSVFGGEHIKYDCVRIFYTGENIVPDFNFCDYAIGFCHLDFGERYLRYPLYLFYEKDYERALNKHKGILGEILRQKQRFCNFIVSNGDANPLRREAFEVISKYKKVDSAGRFLNNIGGAVKDKFAFQSECKFSICFENSNTDGYITEKLIQATAARTIPIYWGDKRAFGKLEMGGGICKNGGINKNAILWVENSADLARVVEEIKRLDNDDDAFLTKLGEPLFLDENHKGIFDACLEQFLWNIFDKNPRDAFARSSSQITQSRETIYKNSIKQYNLFLKIKQFIKAILRR